MVTQAATLPVLLIDEDAVERDSSKSCSKSHGVQVEDFGNAGEFLSKARSIRGQCLILGYNRQVSEGLELVATLRRRGMDLPAIFIVGGGTLLPRPRSLPPAPSPIWSAPAGETALIHAIRAARSSRSEGAPPGGNASETESLPTPARARS